MQDLLKSLYRVYCEWKGQYDLPPEAEDAFQSLVKSLSSLDFFSQSVFSCFTLLHS